MGVDSVHDDYPTRSKMSQACFRRAPWNEKKALILGACTPIELDGLCSNLIAAADETSWPACLFVLELLLDQIIELEKQGDPQIKTSKASPHLKTFTGDSDDFRFHHYLDLVCGVSTGGYVLVVIC